DNIIKETTFIMILLCKTTLSPTADISYSNSLDSSLLLLGSIDDILCYLFYLFIHILYVLCFYSLLRVFLCSVHYFLLSSIPSIYIITIINSYFLFYLLLLSILLLFFLLIHCYIYFLFNLYVSYPIGIFFQFLFLFFFPFFLNFIVTLISLQFYIFLF